MKKLLQSLVLLLMALLVPSTATAAYVQIADGVYQDGTALYIGSGVTSLGALQVNPSVIYCYATIPPACAANTFTGYGAAVHVPTQGMAAYFTALYWYNFTNVQADAVEPQSVNISKTTAQVEVGNQLTLTASVSPSNATPNAVAWYSTNTAVATVSGGTVTTVAPGECDIIAWCACRQAACHLTVTPERVTITLDKHEARLLPNHLLTLTATCTPMSTDLTVMSSDNTVAMPRLVNGTIQVLGLKEGTATITVGSVDGTANTDACQVTVYTEVGDVNCDGYVTITDVTTLIDYLLGSAVDPFNADNADTNRDGNVSISDVTTLIDYLLSGRWSWDVPQTETITVNGVSFKMVAVEGGTFTMGATLEQGSDAYDSEKPAHQVTLSGFAIGETEVTQALWQAVMGSNPSNVTGNLQRPVESVSWNDCQTFIAKLNQLTGRIFRLPTEAEWEFAARGGNLSQGYKYAGSNAIGNVAWYDANSYYIEASSPDYGTHAVGTKAPNELGLYDMSGNVFEWCQDWYGSYTSDAQTNPTGPSSGSDRVDRGGSWGHDAGCCRVSYRDYSYPSDAYRDLGLRLAL